VNGSLLHRYRGI